MSEKILRGSLTQDENVLQGSLSGTNSLKGSLPQQTPATGVILNPEVIYGLSAYQIAVKYGYEGTEQEWLDSLVGGANEKEVTEIAEKVFDNKSVGILTDITTIKQWIDNKDYVSLTLASFTVSDGIYEMGEAVESVSFSWSYNNGKEPKTQLFGETPTQNGTFSGTDIGTTARSKTIENKDGFTTNKSWRLSAVGDKGETTYKDAGITFLNGVYYGALEEPNIYDSAFILRLKKELRSGKKPSFEVTANKNEYIYYCLPTRMGKCSFSMGGFSGGFELVKTIEFTNGEGYKEDYYIYRSEQPNLGVSTVNVS